MSRQCAVLPVNSCARWPPAVPYTIHTVPTGNGAHFTDPSGKTWTPVGIEQMRAEKKRSAMAGPTSHPGSSMTRTIKRSGPNI